ncbi:MAG: NUDIX pyrophosphatase [Candidatus Neomarinimicrobiota bacterium]
MGEVLVRVIDAYVYCYNEDKLRFLIMKRSKTKIYEHLWQGVAGKIEKGETASETAIRELKEETGLIPYRMFVADHVSSFYESNFDRMNMVPVFGIEVKSLDVILSEEHCEFRWTTFEKAYKILTWNGQKKGLKVVYEMLNSKDERIKWSKVLIK